MMLGSLATLAQALHEAHGCAAEIEFFSELVLQKALVAEVQGRLLVGEQKERRRRRFRLRYVVDAHGARLRRAAALQIHVLLQPAVQVRRGDATLTRKGHLIDQRIKLLCALAGFRGDKYDRRVTKKL